MADWTTAADSTNRRLLQLSSGSNEPQQQVKQQVNRRQPSSSTANSAATPKESQQSHPTSADDSIECADGNGRAANNEAPGESPPSEPIAAAESVDSGVVPVDEAGDFDEDAAVAATDNVNVVAVVVQGGEANEEVGEGKCNATLGHRNQWQRSSLRSKVERRWRRTVVEQPKSADSDSNPAANQSAQTNTTTTATTMTKTCAESSDQRSRRDVDEARKSDAEISKLESNNQVDDEGDFTANACDFIERANLDDFFHNYKGKLARRESMKLRDSFMRKMRASDMS